MAAVTEEGHNDSLPKESNVYQRADEAASFVRSKIPQDLQKPQVAIVCGSGLGGIANTIRKDQRIEINYSDIPHFPKTTGKVSTRDNITTEVHVSKQIVVQGHAGQLVFGYMGESKVPVVLLLGRAQ